MVALQEVRLAALPVWRTALQELGFAHVRSAFDHLEPGTRLEPVRRLAVLAAAREPLEVLPSPALPWPERHLAVRLADFDLHVLHAPISQKAGEVKVRTLEAVFAALAEPGERARVLVGDLNTPQYESREGEVQTFARTRSGTLRPDRGERHDRAELLLVKTLVDEHGWLDVFRELHGYARRDRSWVWHHGRGGYRIDHVLVRGLRPAACEYEHGWREARLSDHSAMWARLD